MLKRIKPSPAMAVALLALFVALGGEAYAVARNSVGTAQIRNGAVTNAKLARNSVHHANLGGRVVRNNNIANNSVWHAQLGAGVVQRNNLNASLTSALGGARTVRVSATGSISPHGSSPLVVGCPSGGWVTGGGYHTPFATANVIGSQPAGESNNHPNGWTATVINTGASRITATVFAVCIAP